MPEKKRVGRPKKKSLSEQIYTRQTAWDAQSFVGILPDPDRVLEKLGISPEDAYKDIETDDHITSVRGKRLGKLLALEWDISKGNATDKAYKFVKEVFDNIDVRQFCIDVTRSLAWGYSPIEVIWTADSSYWYPESLKQRPTRWFEYDPENRIRFITNSSVFGEDVPERKLLVPTHQPDYDNPYGVRLLSRCYWLATFKRNAWKWWNQGLEKFAVPFMLAKVPPNTDSVEVSKITSFLEDMVKNAVGVMPNDSELQIIEPSGRSDSSNMYDKFTYSMDKAISKIWLGGTLTTDVGDVGSYAASKTHEDGEDSLVDNDAHMVMDTANKLIQWIMDYNFNSPPPKFVLSKPFNASKELAERDEILNRQGVRFNKKYYETNHGLDPQHFEIDDTPEEEKEDVKPMDKEESKKDETKEDSKDENGFKFSDTFKQEVSKYKDQQFIDDILNSISPQELQEQSENVLKPIIELVNKSTSYEQVADSLLRQWPKMNSQALEDMLLQAVFVSETTGRIGANNDK